MSTASFAFHAATPEQRLRVGVAMLKRPRGFVPVGTMFVFPFAIYLAPSLFMPADYTMMPFAFVLGVAGVVVTTLIVIFAPLLGRVVPSVITFDDAGIHETVGGRVIDRGWEWLVSVSDEQHSVILACGASKSFRLQHGEEGKARTLILAKDDPRLDAMRDLLSRHTRFRV